MKWVVLGFEFGMNNQPANSSRDGMTHITVNNCMETAIDAYNWLGSNKNDLREYVEKAYELARRVGAINIQAQTAGNVAFYSWLRGNVKKMEVLNEEALTLLRKMGNKPDLYFFLFWFAIRYQILGELDKSEQYYKEAVDISKSFSGTQSMLYAHDIPAIYYYNKGEYVKARECLEKLLEVREKSGWHAWQMWNSDYLIRTYIELGEIEKVKKLIDSMYEFALQVRDKEIIAIADALRGMQFRAEKKWQESIDHFEKSLQEYEEINQRRWNAYDFAKRVLVEYARVYLERDQEGDREKAYKLLDEALEIFQKLEAKGEIE